ncbi:MAG: tetratricopeptide repeat protein, partial [Anaerolineae bacterium]
ATSTSTGPARRCPEAPPEPGEGHDEGLVEGLWQGLATLESGDDGAHHTLQSVAQDDNQPAAARAVAAYALGLDALRHDRPAEALAHWESARRLGLDTLAFRDNLHLLYYTCAEQAMTDEQWAKAAALADTGLGLRPADRDLGDLAAAAHFHAGHADAQVARWGQALEHWEKARELGENSRVLLQNLALAYEKTEHFPEAAELWRQVVRRRPRKADAPDALTSQQVALLWGHVAECYRRAGNVEEAITTLRNAVKNDPNNTDLRLELTDALVASEHWEAASNEVDRILEREPNNIGALVRAARLDERYGYLYRARQTWKKVLELDPNHLEARERLVELLHQEGDRLGRFGDLDRALESYREALAYMPDEPYLYILLAECYFYKDDPDAARREMDRAFALNPADLEVYHIAVDACHIADHPDDAEWVITQAEELAGPHQPAGHLPAKFYVDLAHCCFNRRQAKIGDDYVRRAEQMAEGDPDGLVDIGNFYLDRKDAGRAVAYFERALRLDPEHGWANLQMGASYAANLEMREARRHWRQARRTARRTGDEELLQAVEMARQTFDHAIEMIERGISPFEMFGDLDMEMSDDYYDDEYW